MDYPAPLIDLRHLRHALALAEHGSFARAAQACFITQSALTRSIQALEASLECVLFERTRTGVEVTELGRLVLRHAMALDTASHALVRELRVARGLDAGDLVVGVGLYGGSSLIAPVVAQMNRAHPKLRIHVQGAPWTMLPMRARARGTDLIVAEQGILLEHSGFETQALSAHRAIVACRPGHPLALAGDARFEDLRRYPIVGPDLSDASLERLCAKARPEVAAALRAGDLLTIRCESAPLLKEVLMESDALAVMYPFMIERELASGQLDVLRDVDLGASMRFAVGWIAGRALSPAASLFIDLLRRHDEALADRHRWEPAEPPARRPSGRGVEPARRRRASRGTA